jgi:hypothetical protein
MLGHVVSSAAFALVAAGVLFQLLTLTRLAAKIARGRVARVRRPRLAALRVRGSRPSGAKLG